jgi:hypothetical protein
MFLGTALTLGGTLVWAAGPPSGFPVVRPQATCDEATDRELILIPADWKAVYPFSARFAEGSELKPGELVLDLRAARFVTSGLIQRAEAGRSRFLMPDLSTFSPELRQEKPEQGFRYIMVQAATPQEQTELRKQLTQAGMAILDYLPNMAYLVRLPADRAVLLQTMPAVFWAGDFVPAYRIDPELDFVIEANPEHWLQITALFDKALYANKHEVKAAASASGAAVLSVEAGEGQWIVRLEGQAQAARKLAQIPGCLWTERYVPAELDNNVARTSSSVPTGRGSQSGPIMDVENVWAKGIHGEGQIAAAADTGLSTGNLATLHKDFGDQADANNPMRVKTAWALGRTGDWSDPAPLGGGHGTHTSGSIVGNGFRSGSTPSTNTFPSTSYAGIAPKAQYDFQSIMTSSGSLTLPSDLNNLFQPPYDDGARVHSNSWGAAVAGAYNTNAQNVDKFTWNNKDMVITFSAGNSGVDSSPSDGVIDRNSIGSPGTAKNCITVGASEDYRPGFQYEYPQGTCNTATWGWFNGSSYSKNPVFSDPMADNANGLAAFSSRGPVADGRIKPDLVAPGVAIISTRTDQNQDWEQWGLCGIPTAFQPYYIFMGGTSMANPLTAGSAVLVRQYYSDGWHANHSATTNGSASAGDGFDPSSALVKATLINGAWDMTPGQYGTGTTQEIPPGWDTGHDLPNNAEGYGRVDLMHSLFPGSGWADMPDRKLAVHDVSPGLQTGQSDSYTFIVTSSSNPFIATLVWTDPYGATSAGTELVNNLDLTVTAPDSTVYYPNGLNKTSGADAKNNVEQVKLTNPQLGTYTITVNGTSVPGNGQAGTTTQPYALVISGVASSCANNPSAVDVTPNGPLTLCTGTAQLLTANVTGGTGPFTYQWTRDGVDIPGANAATYGASDTGSHSYNCKVTGSGCTSYLLDTAATQLTWQAYPTFAGLGSVTCPFTATCTLDLAWSAATAYCGGPVTYNVYRSTTSGFTPSASNRIATGIAATTYSDIAMLASGTTYYYVVRAVDNANGAEDPNTLQLSGVPYGAPVPTTLYSQDFESAVDVAGWRIGYFVGNASDWRGVQACAPANSGSNIFRYGGTTCTGNYTSAKIAFAAPGGASGITVPAGSTNVRLSFYHRWNWYNSTYRDGAFMLLSTNGTNFMVVPSSAIVAGGYTGTTSIASGCASRGVGTGRNAWTGTQSTMVNTLLDLDAASQAIWGVPAAGQTFWIAFTAITGCSGANYGWFIDDVAVTANVPGSCSAVCPTISLSPASLPSPVVGSAYSQTLTAGGGFAPYTFAVTAGTLPAGLGLDSASGAINGTPTSAGLSTFTITATDSQSCTGSQSYTLTAVCPTISLSPTTLPSPTVGYAYSQTIDAGGGTAPYVYTVTTGSLPAGLSLNSTTGILSGTPSVGGTFTFTIQAQDANGCVGTQAYLLRMTSYDLSFIDDNKRSSVCVNSKTGDWQYSVLSGLGKGIYKGKGSVTKTAAQWSFRSAAGSPQLFLLTYYPPMSLASGSLGGGSFVSSLYDKNTKDDTFLCGP